MYLTFKRQLATIVFNQLLNCHFLHQKRFPVMKYSKKNEIVSENNCSSREKMIPYALPAEKYLLGVHLVIFHLHSCFGPKPIMATSEKEMIGVPDFKQELDGLLIRFGICWGHY